MDMRPHIPTPEAVAEFAERLAQHEAFQEEGLALAFYDASRDGALLYEGERDEVITEACIAQGLRLADEIEEEDADPHGIRMWVRHSIAELALLLLVEREVARQRSAALAVY